jgi:hypothetical protein
MIAQVRDVNANALARFKNWDSGLNFVAVTIDCQSDHGKSQVSIFRGE